MSNDDSERQCPFNSREEGKLQLSLVIKLTNPCFSIGPDEHKNHKNFAFKIILLDTLRGSLKLKNNWELAPALPEEGRKTHQYRQDVGYNNPDLGTSHEE